MNIGLKRSNNKAEHFEELRGTIRHSFVNKPQTKFYVEACERLAKSLYDVMPAAGPDVEVLDVGCGFGDQAIYFRSLHPQGPRYTGINIGPQQAKVAGERVAHLRDMEVLAASATDLSQFAPDRFSWCFALECAFHFDTRAKFFHEAFRVLKPGGGIALTDVFSFPALEVVSCVWPQLSLLDKTIIRLLGKYQDWFGNQPESVEPLNREKDFATYEASLREAGFEQIVVEDIDDQVFLWSGPCVEACNMEVPRWSLRGLYWRIVLPWNANCWAFNLFVSKKKENSYDPRYVKVTARKPIA